MWSAYNVKWELKYLIASFTSESVRSLLTFAALLHMIVCRMLSHVVGFLVAWCRECSLLNLSNLVPLIWREILELGRWVLYEFKLGALHGVEHLLSARGWQSLAQFVLLRSHLCCGETLSMLSRGSLFCIHYLAVSLPLLSVLV